MVKLCSGQWALQLEQRLAGVLERKSTVGPIRVKTLFKAIVTKDFHPLLDVPSQNSKLSFSGTNYAVSHIQNNALLLFCSVLASNGLGTCVHVVVFAHLCASWDSPGTQWSSMVLNNYTLAIAIDKTVTRSRGLHIVHMVHTLWTDMHYSFPCVMCFLSTLTLRRHVANSVATDIKLPYSGMVR